MLAGACGKVSDAPVAPAGAGGASGAAGAAGSSSAAADAAGLGGGVAGGGGAAGSAGADGGGAGGAGGAACAPQASLAPARVWQLTDREYVNVVRQVFGISLSDVEAPKVDPSAPGVFNNDSEIRQVDFNDAVEYDRAAEVVAVRAAANLTSFLSCATLDEACVEAFLKKTLPRAYRRPVAPSDVADLMTLYRGAASTDGVAAGVGLVVQAILMSPFFLYRTELGTDAAIATTEVTLTPYELASALSFMFIDSAPDDPLWSAAESGDLANLSTLAGQVQRLLALPDARANLDRMVSYWLDVEAPATVKNRQAFPVYTPELAVDLDKSLKTFLDDVVWKGRLSDLFTSSRVYVNAQLSSVYSITGGLDATFVPVDMPNPERRAGILTQPGMLMAMNKNEAIADVVHRGLFVYRSLLCGADAGDIPPPPADEAAVAATMTGTEREKAAKRAMLSCGGCHSLIDPLGLVFERYDAIGRYNATLQVAPDPMEPGKFVWTTSPTPIDTSAVAAPLLGMDLAGPIGDVGELARKLAGAKKRVAYCAARHVGRYAVGYDPKDSCTVRAAGDVFLQSESFQDLFKALATLPGFRTRDAVR
jgi:hypothetical protein